MNAIAKSRLVFIQTVIALLFIVIIGRMLHITIFNQDYSDFHRYKSSQGKEEKRGNILDRNGVILATDIATKALYVNPQLIKNRDKTAKLLSEMFSDLSYEQIIRKIIPNQKRSWILIRRNLTPNQVLKVKNLHIAGLVFDTDKSRVYPHKSVASHIVGYSDVDRNGLAGIEITYDKTLKNGKNVNLTVDIRLQDIMVDELQKALEQNKAKSAGGVIFDVNNGEILALASLPNFDPNISAKIEANQRFNRIVNGVYELGSILKIFTNAIAFEENLLKESEIFNVKDPIKYGRFTISDDHRVKDKMNFEEIFIHSSNIGTVKIAEKFGAKKQKEFFKKIGLLDKINVDFEGLGKPIYPKRWREINLYTIAYGHGIAVTPLHIAMAVSAMVNGGNLINPTFTKRSMIEKHKIITNNTSQNLRNLMRKAVTNGTGGKADIKGYEIAGKTGTAEKAELGSYNKTKTIASFVAVFPISKPKYLLYILFDKPDTQFNTGGMVAAPVAGKIIENIAPIVNLQPTIEY